MQTFLPARHRPNTNKPTVLFADVVHSMDIAAALGGGAAPLRDHDPNSSPMRRRWWQRYGGTVDKFTGERHRWRCSAPRSRWKTTRCARTLAALGIQEDVTRLAAEVQRRDGVW